MWKAFAFVVVISVLFGSSHSTCIEVDSCRQQFAYVLLVMMEGETPNCTDLRGYIDCLEPCENASPSAALQATFDQDCTDTTTQAPDKAYSFVNMYLNMFGMFSTDLPLNIEPAALQSLEDCTQLSECIPKDLDAFSSTNNTVVCRTIQPMFECWSNVTTDCNISENLTYVMTQSRQQFNSLCTAGDRGESLACSKDINTMCDGRIQIDPIIERLLVELYNSTGMSVAEMNQLMACGFLTDCMKYVNFDISAVSQMDILQLCQVMVPLYQCLNNKINNQSCEASEEVKSDFGQRTGYMILSCMASNSSNTAPDAPKNDVDEVFLQMLRGDGTMSALNSPGCDGLFQCAVTAQANTMESVDDETYCSNLKLTNLCIDDNIDSCPMAAQFQGIIDTAREEEAENCPSDGACQATYCMRMVLAVPSVILIYLLKAEI